MHCRAWRKPGCDSNPLSPYYSEPPSAYIQKLRGSIPSSCVTDPAIQIYGSECRQELNLKLTTSGVVFLHSRRFKKRYTGSATCAVDMNGMLWLNGRELDREIKADGGKGGGKKKRRGLPPSSRMLYSINQMTGCNGQGAISQEFSDTENISPDCEQKKAKKERKKSYVVDKQKVRARILAMINTQKGKKHLFFWTVSFPAGTADQVCYQAFNTWLTSLRQRGMLKDYLWVAERQTGERLPDGRTPTNTIHFHIAIPHYMNVQRANAMMRGTLKNLAKKGLIPGAMCSSATGATYYMPCVAKYNGVDIAKNRKTGRVVNFAIKKGSRTLSYYLTKYVTKNDAEFSHLAWHNSRGFSALFTGVTFTIDEFKKAGFGFFLNRTRARQIEYATFIPWIFGPPPKLMDHLFTLNSYVQTLLE